MALWAPAITLLEFFSLRALRADHRVVFASAIAEPGGVIERQRADRCGGRLQRTACHACRAVAASGVVDLSALRAIRNEQGENGTATRNF